MKQSQLVEQLVDEAERCRRYPGLAFRGRENDRRAWLVGSPFDVWEAVQAWQDLDEDDAATREQFNLNDRQLNLAKAYYREFTDEINSALTLTRRTSEELEKDYPFIEVIRIPE
jgi:hypothetical protein